MTGPSGLHAILDVVLEGQKTVHPSILADYQRDPIRGTLSHIDLREVRLDQPIQASVVVHLVGESVGVKAGGVVSLVTREIHVEALPMNVPEHIDADVTALEIGDVLRLEDIGGDPRTSRSSTIRTRPSSRPSRPARVPGARGGRGCSRGRGRGRGWPRARRRRASRMRPRRPRQPPEESDEE